MVSGYSKWTLCAVVAAAGAEVKPIVKKLQRYAQYSDLWVFSQIVGSLWKLKPWVKKEIAAHAVRQEEKDTRITRIILNGSHYPRDLDRIYLAWKL